MERVDFITAESGDDLIVAFTISRGDPDREELEDAKKILRAMNFDSRFRIHFS